MSHLKEDLNRVFRAEDNLLKRLKIIFLTQGIWAIIVFRAGSYCLRKRKTSFLAKVFLPIFTLLSKFVEIVAGISIPFSAKIGKGFYIGHFGGIILGPNITIGEYCNISQGVTIGQAGRGGVQESPVIGNRVYIAPGAKIFGGITIGDNVAIGANAVVGKDLPENAVAVGIPAKVISYDSSDSFII